MDENSHTVIGLRICGGFSSSWNSFKSLPKRRYWCGHNLLSQCKLQLQRIERKPFEELPTVRCFLEKVKVDDDGKSKFQDVVLKDFDRRKESACNLNSTWASVILKTIQLRLEDGNDLVVSKYLVHVSNHYEKDSEFISKGIEELIEFYKLPLQTAGNHTSATEFLFEFHDMVSYALKYFDLSNTIVLHGTDYLNLVGETHGNQSCF